MSAPTEKYFSVPSDDDAADRIIGVGCGDGVEHQGHGGARQGIAALRLPGETDDTDGAGRLGNHGGVHARNQSAFIRRGVRMMGRNPIWSSTSVSRSTPGANSIQFDTLGRQPEHGAFGNVDHLLPAPDGFRTAEGDGSHVLDEFADAAMGADRHRAVRHLDLGAFRVEGAAEHDFPGALRDVDEAAGAVQIAVEMANVDVAGTVEFGHAEKRRVQTAAMVENRIAWSTAR